MELRVKKIMEETGANLAEVRKYLAELNEEDQFCILQDIGNLAEDSVVQYGVYPTTQLPPSGIFALEPFPIPTECHNPEADPSSRTYHLYLALFKVCYDRTGKFDYDEENDKLNLPGDILDDIDLIASYADCIGKNYDTGNPVIKGKYTWFVPSREKINEEIADGLIRDIGLKVI